MFESKPKKGDKLVIFEIAEMAEKSSVLGPRIFSLTGKYHHHFYSFIHSFIY